MNFFKKLAWRTSIIALVGLSLAGCGDKDKIITPPNNGGGGLVVKQQDQFGMAFAAAFGADNNSEPKTVNDGDIVAVSLTTEPVTIN